MRYWLLTLTLLLTCSLRSQDDSDRRDVLWKNIKQQLQSATGPQYFEENMKDALLPPLRGTLVSSTPRDRPSEFLLTMPGSDTPDVTLRLNGSLEKELPAGSPVVFSGVAVSFRPEPFLLTFKVSILE